MSSSKRSGLDAAVASLSLSSRSLIVVQGDSDKEEPPYHEDEHHEDELDFLAAGTLARRKEALAAGDADAKAAPQHRALYFRRNGDADRLFEAASRRLSRDPGCVRALMIRASVLVKKGDHAAALEDYASVLRAEPDHLEATFGAGACLERMGRLREAVAAFSAAASLDPSGARALYARGACNNLLGDFEAANDDYARALEKDKASSEAAAAAARASRQRRRERGEERSRSVSPTASKVSKTEDAACYSKKKNIVSLVASSSVARSFPPPASRRQHHQFRRQREGEEARELGGDGPSLIGDGGDDVGNLDDGGAVMAATRTTATTVSRDASTGPFPTPESATATIAGKNPSSTPAKTKTAPSNADLEAAAKHAAAGYAARKRGDYELAVSHYTSALELDRSCFRARFDRAFAADKLGRHLDAAADYRECVRARPDCALAHYNLGISLDRGAGTGDEAVASFTRALELDPENAADAHHNRGFALRKMGRLREAIADYDAAISLGAKRGRPGGHARALYNRAFAHARLGDVASALRDYEATVELDRGNAAALHNLGALHERVASAAEAAAARARRDGRGDEKPAPSSADSAAAASSNRKALEAYNAAIAAAASSPSRPPPAPTLHARAVLLDKLGKKELALRDHAAAAAADPTSAALARSLGAARRAAGDLGGAEDALSAAIALESSESPGEGDASAASSRSLRGYVRRKLGRFAEAAEDYARALELQRRQRPSPSYSASVAARLHVSLAYCLAKAGDPSAAVANYDAAIELEEAEAASKRKEEEQENPRSSPSYCSPSLSHARHNRGVLLARRGDHAAAVEDFDAALAALGREGEAAAATQSSDGSNSAVAALLFSRGSSLDALGRFEEAVADYMRALSVGGGGGSGGSAPKLQKQKLAAAAGATKTRQR